MVQVKYLGQNSISFGKSKLVNGLNDIADADFYKLMQYPTFAARVKSKVFSVPSDFPLEQKKDLDKKEEEKKSDEKELKSQNSFDESLDSEHLSQRDLMKAIEKSDDEDYLKSLLESEKRSKVLNALQKRLDALEQHKAEDNKKQD